jgi:hypothetical protein
MKIFLNPQDPFLTPEFCNLLSSRVRLTYIRGVPTINGKTFFWSTKKFDEISKQYLIGDNLPNARKSFFILDPKPYTDAVKAYAPAFRNKIQKASKNNLQFEAREQAPLQLIEACYKMYDANMAQIKTFSFDFDFFRSLFTLPYATLLTVTRKKELVSFGLMFGNLLFVQSSSVLGKALCANNLLYDRLFQLLENKIIFSGIAGKNNLGLYAFKLHAGLKPIPAQPTYFNPIYYIPKFLRHNALAGFFLRQIDKKKILPYVLPY